MGVETSERTLAVRAAGLRFSYRGGPFTLAVDSLEVKAGERVAVVGPSGSGKTTLLYLLAGIYEAQAGELEVAGDRLDRMNDVARRAFRVREVGLVFQDFGLLDYISVQHNVLLPFYINGALQLDADARARAADLAASLGLEDKWGRGVTALSAGERQRVALCRALVAQPSLLLADEPTGNLDPSAKERAMQVLFEQAAASNATLMVVTHDHSLLEGFDRVIDFADFRAEGG